MTRRIGRYEITGELGVGGFGSVYRGYDPTVQRVVAIKVLSTQGDAGIVNRFRTEAMTAGGLNHRNIVTIYEFGEDAGSPFLAMEYLDGIDLQHIITNKTNRESLTLLEKLEIMAEAAQGLQCAHEHGVVHRDVKPANIMRLKDGSVKIMDFGIARLTNVAATRLTQTGMMIGTVFYMAPEQFKSTEVDALCDIWAYGVVFYELLTGVHPFRANDPAGVMYRITMEEPPLVSSLVPGCPRELDASLKALLSKDRQKRIQSLDDFLLDLEPIIRNLAKVEVPELLCQAERLIEADRTDTAQTVIGRILKLDRSNQAARHLRERLRERSRLQAIRPKIDALMQEADEQMAGRNFAGAIERLNSAIALDPGSPTLRSRVERLRGEEQRARQADELISRGRRALTDGDLTGAFTHFSEALHTDPGHDQVPALLDHVKRAMHDREMQAQIKEVMGQANDLIFIQAYDVAISLLSDLEEKTASDEQVVRRLLEARQLKQAQETRDKLNAGINAARELMKHGSYQEACQALEELDRENPDSPAIEVLLTHANERLRVEGIASEVDAFLAQARQHRADGNFDEALQQIGRALELDRASGKALALQRTYLDDAQTDRDRRKIDAELQQCRDLLSRGKLDEALAFIDRLAADHPRDSRVAGAKREISARVAERDRLRRNELQRGIQEAERLLAGGLAESATKLLGGLTVQFPAEPAVRDLVDRAQHLKLSQDAQDRLNASLSAAKGLLKDGDLEQACIALDELDRQYPNNSAVQDLSKVARERLQAKEISVRSEELRAKAKSERAKGRIEQALEFANRAFEVDPGNEETVDLQRALRAELQSALDRKNVSVELENCAALVKEAKLEDALAAVQRLENKYPKEPRVVDARQSIAARIGEKEERERRVREGVLRAERFLSDGDAESATKLLTALLAKFPETAKLQGLLKQSRQLGRDLAQKEEVRKNVLAAREFAGRREWEKALGVLDRGREKQPECREYLEEVERIKRLRDCDRALAAVESALESGQLLQAISMAEAAMAKFPEEPRAAALLQTARNRRELNELVVYVRRRVANGDLDEARQLLTEGLARFPDSVELREIQSEIDKAQRLGQSVHKGRVALQRRAFGEARDIVNALLAAQPRNTAALQLLGEIDTQQKEHERQLAYDQGRAQGERLLRSLQFEGAIEKFRQLLREFPDDPALRQDLDRACAARDQQARQEAYTKGRSEVRTLSAAGHLDEATQRIQGLLQTFPGDPALIADLDSIGKARLFREERARLDAVIGELEALFRKGDAEGVQRGARELLKQHREPRAVELLEWAEKSIKQAKAIRKKGKTRRPVLVWGGIGSGACLALAVYLLWPSHETPTPPPPLTLTSVFPNSGVQGATVPINLTGAGFASGVKVILTDSRASVSDVKVVSATQITAALSIAPGATTGPTSVSVATSGGSSGAVPFTVNAAPANHEITIEPGELTFSWRKGNPLPPPKPLRIKNLAKDEKWSIAGAVPWLLISSRDGRGESTVNLQIDTAKVTAATDTGLLKIKTAGSIKSAVVHLRVTEALSAQAGESARLKTEADEHARLKTEADEHARLKAEADERARIKAEADERARRKRYSGIERGRIVIDFEAGEFEMMDNRAMKGRLISGSLPGFEVEIEYDSKCNLKVSPNWENNWKGLVIGQTDPAKTRITLSWTVKPQ